MTGLVIAFFYMAIDRETVEKLAKLSRIEIGSEEKDSMVKDLESVLVYVSELSNVSGVSDEYPLEENRNVFREDENPDPSGKYTDRILAEAPKTENGYILVKQVIGEKGNNDSVR